MSMIALSTSSTLVIFSLLGMREGRQNKWHPEGQYQGNRVGGNRVPAQLLQIFTNLFSYMRPRVVVKEVGRIRSWPFFLNSVRQFMKLVGVNVAGDSVSGAAARNTTILKQKRRRFLW